MSADNDNRRPGGPLTVYCAVIEEAIRHLLSETEYRFAWDAFCGGMGASDAAEEILAGNLIWDEIDQR